MSNKNWFEGNMPEDSLYIHDLGVFIEREFFTKWICSSRPVEEFYKKSENFSPETYKSYFEGVLKKAGRYKKELSIKAKNPDEQYINTIYNYSDFNGVDFHSLKNYFTKESLLKFKEGIEGIYPRKKGFPFYAGVKKVDFDRSQRLIAGWKVESVSEGLKLTCGLKSRNDITEDLWISCIRHENFEYTVSRNDPKYVKIVSKIVEYFPDIELHSLTFNVTPDESLYNTTEVAIWKSKSEVGCYDVEIHINDSKRSKNENSKEEYYYFKEEDINDFKKFGEHSMGSPYNPAVWGWT